MAFNINEFRSQMLFDGARPNLFSISLSFPRILGRDLASRKITFAAHAASIPDSTVGMARSFYFGREIKHPGDRVFRDWDITVINDEDFSLRDAFEAWSNLLNNHNENTRNAGAVNYRDYSTLGSVTHYGKAGDALKTYFFHGLFPTSVAPIQLAWAQNDTIEEFGVTLSYQYWENDVTPSL